jgi:spore germination protein KB
MKKATISQNQAISIVAMFVMGSSLVLGLARSSKQDTWISLSIAVIAVMPFIYIYARLMKRFPGKNLFDISIEVFGKVLGKIVIALYAWYSFHLGAMVLRNFSEFMEIRVFEHMPQYISLLCMGILVIWVVRRGPEVLGRWSVITLPITLFIVVATTALLFKDMHPEYLLPIGENLHDVPKDAFSNFSYPLGETVLFLGLLNALKHGDKPGKVWLYGILIGAGALMLSFFRNIMSMGLPLLGDKNFPSYDSTSLIIAGSVISRIENVVGANLLLCGFVKISVCLMAATKGIAKLFNSDDDHPFVAPLGLLMVTLGGIVYSNAMEMFDFLNVYSYYSFPFQVIIPLLLCITAEIKFIVKSKKEKGGAQTGPAPAEEL